MSNNIADIDCAWLSHASSSDHITVSSRIRLARNLEDFPFPNNLKADEAKQVRQLVASALKSAPNKYLFATVNDIPALSRQVLLEKHMISPQHTKDETATGGIAVSLKGDISVMVNEEDHIRMQCLLPGLNLDECWERIDKLDNSLEAELDFAYDDDFGYLTACPTNVGTGLRASVMLHLPALVHTNSISNALGAISKVGFVVRGLYGEGTDALGNMFQVSNQITLGLSEQELILNLRNVTSQLIEQEKKARDFLYRQHRIQLEDSIGRAQGILTGARKISSQEAMKLLSEVRLGIAIGMITNISPATLNELMVCIQPASLQKIAKEKLSAERRDIVRATILRQRLQAQ